MPRASDADGFHIPGERQSSRLKAKPPPPQPPLVFDNDDKDDDYLGEEDQLDFSEDEAPGFSGFQLKTTLPSSRATERELGQLISMIDGPYLDLCPDYQRDVVWSAPRMIGLVNSLMENFYIPPIIFNLKPIVRADGTPVFKRVCVDGKQRLSSVHAFMKGDIPVLDKRGRKWFYCYKKDANGREFRQKSRLVLPPESARRFSKKTFLCQEYNNLTHEQEEDLFGRVQKGVQLTPAEKLRATTGSWQKFAKLFEQDFSTVVNLSTTARSLGFRHILACFSQIMELQKPAKDNRVPTIKTNAMDTERLLKKPELLDMPTRSHLSRVFSTFKTLIQKDPKVFENNNYRKAKNFAPVEIVAVACLISMYGDTRDHDTLLGDIAYMRTFLRAELPDLRMYTTTWNSIWKYLDNLESYRGAVDGSTGTKWSSRKSTSQASQISQSSNPPNNRPRKSQQQHAPPPDIDDSMDLDLDPAPITSLPTPPPKSTSTTPTLAQKQPYNSPAVLLTSRPPQQHPHHPHHNNINNTPTTPMVHIPPPATYSSTTTGFNVHLVPLQPQPPQRLNEHPTPSLRAEGEKDVKVSRRTLKRRAEMELALSRAAVRPGGVGGGREGVVRRTY